MKPQLAPLGFVVMCGAWMAAPSTPMADTLAATQGKEYAHSMPKSRFDLGAGGHTEVEGPYQRIRGQKGVFLVDTVTGATLAVRNAPAVAKGAPVIDETAPLTNDPAAHSRIARDYLVSAGVPAAEVSGTHVTTTMAGGGRVSDGVQPTRSKLLYYTTHLDRSLGGIPVEGSYAFAALDRDGKVITEGVYWPAIDASVIRRAQALKRKLASAAERAGFLEKVKGTTPAAEETTGDVRIVHTSAGYHGKFEADAVYSVVVRNPGGGKAEIVRFTDAGTRLTMADDQPSEVDSRKQK